MMSDQELLVGFENCTLPSAQWNHQAHVRIAFLYASRHSFQGAIEKMRASLQRYNRAVQIPEALDRGFHETITQAFMRLVIAAVRNADQDMSSDVFCAANPDLLDRQVLRRYYSQERLRTWEAKQEFVAPDLSPLPVVTDGG
jgi:hypothetical protein